MSNKNSYNKKEKSLYLQVQNKSLKNQKRTKTPQFKTQTPRKYQRNNLSPLNKRTKKDNKLAVYQKSAVQDNNRLAVDGKTEVSQAKRVNLSQTPCKQCEAYKKQVVLLQCKLENNQKILKQIQFQLIQLKIQSENKIRKYKAKSKLQRDQLQLLKGPKNETEYTNKNESQNAIHKQKVSDRKIINEKSVQEDEPNKKQVTKAEQTKKDKQTSSTDLKLFLADHNLNIKTQVLTSHKPTNNKQNLPASRQLYLQAHINILEQKLFQLTVKNDFLQNLKIKQEKIGQDGDVVNFDVPVSFSKQFQLKWANDSDCRDLGPLCKTQRFSICQQRGHQNRTKWQDVDPQREPWDVPVKLEHPQVQSRYLYSQLKQRPSNDQHKQQARNSRKRFDQQQKTNIPYPEGKSRYCDSIKERSRLLGM